MQLRIHMAILADLLRIEAPQTYVVDLDRTVNRTLPAANPGAEGARTIPQRRAR